ncbi:M23 family metallopeptidase [Streptomyces pathocidini]|uniref:M23 family metallopeptidase n=1 Tax=Streptomyces pathocidini TaxID=1650571 RepID=A0ABW7UIU7_9ACTN|nr:M23 family metallopeptidase [Streptomyces pathocidini]
MASIRPSAPTPAAAKPAGKSAGRHRRPGRLARSGAQFGSIATLAATGIAATVAAPALAAPAERNTSDPEASGLRQAVVIGDRLAETVDAQARAQRGAAEAAEARAKAEAQARKAAEEARRVAEAKAEKERAERARAAREAERKRLNTFVPPISGSYISTGYQSSSGLWSSGSHTGIDFHAASGTAVHAVGTGTVVEAGWGGSYGNNIVIKMSDGTYTQYGHLSSIAVSVGQKVTPGRQIGLSGATGNVTGPHLHFEARTSPDYGSDIDPVAYLRSHGLNV